MTAKFCPDASFGAIVYVEIPIALAARGEDGHREISEWSIRAAMTALSVNNLCQLKIMLSFEPSIVLGRRRRAPHAK